MIWELFGHTFYFFAEERQWEKLQNYLELYLMNNIFGTMALIVSSVVVVLFIASVVARGNRKRKWNYASCICYGFVLILLFLFARESGTRGLRLLTADWYLIENGFHEANILISVINLLLFIPFGFLLRKAFGPGHSIGILSVSLGTALLIELLQYVFARGYSSIQDILMYMLGDLLGWCLMALLCLMKRAILPTSAGQ